MQSDGRTATRKRCGGFIPDSSQQGFPRSLRRATLWWRDVTHDTPCNSPTTNRFRYVEFPITLCVSCGFFLQIDRSFVCVSFAWLSQSLFDLQRNANNIHINAAGACLIGNVFGLYSGGIIFESRPRSSTEGFSFLSSSRRLSVYYLKLGHCRFLLHPSLFVIHYNRAIFHSTSHELWSFYSLR
jgi:hypothetical protein